MGSGFHLSYVQGLKRGSWSDMQYKGDWMRRPLASSEVGWLVRLLVYLSDSINASLRLNQPLPEELASAKPEMDLQVSRPESCHQNRLLMPSTIFLALP